MRKIILATLLVLPIGGLAVKAFAANTTSVAAVAADPASASDPLYGTTVGASPAHKHLSIKGIVVESENDDAGEGSGLDE